MVVSLVLHQLGAALPTIVNMNGAGHYFHWGFIQLSLANFVVIVLMLVVFVLALVLPFPTRHRDKS
jgi:uncharacterized membrane protein